MTEFLDKFSKTIDILTVFLETKWGPMNNKEYEQSKLKIQNNRIESVLVPVAKL